MKKSNCICVFSLYNLCAVRGVTDVEGQLFVVVFHDRFCRLWQRAFLEQGHRAASESAASHPWPASSPQHVGHFCLQTFFIAQLLFHQHFCRTFSPYWRQLEFTPNSNNWCITYKIRVKCNAFYCQKTELKNRFYTFVKCILESNKSLKMSSTLCTRTESPFQVAL